ncbi:MAG: hypothetical protein CMA63_03195 [Euryarchaeota archaeon]|nr:hypothetical protein [Euryarchaeota archaeon]|tara:strand:+ start:28708 stop:29127 length:420 start_codon:yes stop_codon:yes gene_type:complete
MHRKPLTDWHGGRRMGLFGAILRFFSSSPLVHDVTQPELVDEQAEHLAIDFSQRREAMAVEAMDELSSPEVKPTLSKAPTAALEYDSGTVDAEDLLELETTLLTHTDVNVIEHDSVDHLGNHLSKAVVLGDIPQEVEFS